MTLAASLTSSIIHSLNHSLTLTDSEKQQSINLFLGVFTPRDDDSATLWETPTDFYLHNETAATGRALHQRRK